MVGGRRQRRRVKLDAAQLELGQKFVNQPVRGCRKVVWHLQCQRTTVARQAHKQARVIRDPVQDGVRDDQVDVGRGSSFRRVGLDQLDRSGLGEHGRGEVYAGDRGIGEAGV